MDDTALMPLPLELLTAPDDLSGESGTNRAPAFITQQISATNDLQAILCWLANSSSHHKLTAHIAKKRNVYSYGHLLKKRNRFQA